MIKYKFIDFILFLALFFLEIKKILALLPYCKKIIQLLNLEIFVGEMKMSRIRSSFTSNIRLLS